MSVARTLTNLFGIARITGCTMHTSPGAGDTRIKRVAEPPPVAFAKATKAVLHEGGSITSSIFPKFISARAEGGMTLNIIIMETASGGATVETFVKLDAGKIAFGSITLGDRVLARYDTEVP